MKQYTAELSDRAKLDLLKLREWRRTNRGTVAVHAFDDELDAALALLERFPRIASYAPGRRRGTFSKTIHRLILNETGYCFSYRVNDKARVIAIRRIWPQRGRPPVM